MIISNKYNHLNAEEYLLVQRPEQYDEIKNAIARINANDYLKVSCEAKRLGEVLYSQSEINKAVKGLLGPAGWKSKRVDYYVTSDEATTREIVNVADMEEQKRIIEERGFTSYPTFNEVDFQKERVAVEVQFGKYFSVAYDLHVKHTFFYARNDIDVGIEIIPTKAMCEHMDSGVSWFENEVTNVIREGRTNPPVPILVLGIQPDDILSKDPASYSDAELITALHNSDIRKFREQVAKKRKNNKIRTEEQARVDRIEHCLKTMGA